jgi:hypothetical protein
MRVIEIEWVEMHMYSNECMNNECGTTLTLMMSEISTVKLSIEREMSVLGWEMEKHESDRNWMSRDASVFERMHEWWVWHHSDIDDEWNIDYQAIDWTRDECIGMGNGKTITWMWMLLIDENTGSVGWRETLMPLTKWTKCDRNNDVAWQYMQCRPHTEWKHEWK